MERSQKAYREQYDLLTENVDKREVRQELTEMNYYSAFSQLVDRCSEIYLTAVDNELDVTGVQYSHNKKQLPLYHAKFK
jgi:hypothetical protein